MSWLEYKVAMAPNLLNPQVLKTVMDRTYERDVSDVLVEEAQENLADAFRGHLCRQPWPESNRQGYFLRFPTDDTRLVNKYLRHINNDFEYFLYDYSLEAELDFFDGMELFAPDFIMGDLNQKCGHQICRGIHLMLQKGIVNFKQAQLKEREWLWFFTKYNPVVISEKNGSTHAVELFCNGIQEWEEWGTIEDGKTENT